MKKQNLPFGAWNKVVIKVAKIDLATGAIVIKTRWGPKVINSLVYKTNHNKKKEDK